MERCRKSWIGGSHPEANPYDPQWEPYFEKRWERQWKTKHPSTLKTLWLKQNGLCPACQGRLGEEDELEEDPEHPDVPPGRRPVLDVRRRGAHVVRSGQVTTRPYEESRRGRAAARPRRSRSAVRRGVLEAPLGP